MSNTVGAASSLLHSSLAYAPQLRPEDRSDFEQALVVVIARTEQLNAFMRSFADVVRLPAPSKRAGDVGALVERVARLLQPEAERRHVRWAWERESPLPPVVMDEAQIEQALLNVVKNALEAIGEDGIVTLRLARRQGFRPHEAHREGLSNPGLRRSTSREPYRSVDCCASRVASTPQT